MRRKLSSPKKRQGWLQTFTPSQALAPSSIHQYTKEYHGNSSNYVFPEIPKKYKAVIYDEPGKISTKVVELDTPTPGPGEVLINLTHSGVCHSDMGIMTNSWKALPHPTQAGQVGGHEGVGKIVAMGPGTENAAVKVGQRVGVKWISGVCGGCPACLSGHDGVCFNQKVSGYYTPGTYQQYVLGPADYVTPIPDELDSAAAAPIGAEHFIDHTTSKDVAADVQALTGGLGAQAVLVLTAANGAYASGMQLLKFGGTLVCVGLPEGDLQPIATAFPQVLVAKEQKIVGSAVGNRKEAIETLDLAARGIIKTHFRTAKMDELTSIFEEMDQGKIQGRVVLDLQ
ncbi:unnamed protein product [Aureobasidium vineae]|uniref:Enoyl reductase (ER) domain-containing protein n=1 Tax=Aureobasidium vineae TaxID=2773715 RepID=A0A9N8JCS7_9PEZI|nr:unnamed protein product [Aureobasidium vineae]